MKNNVYELLLQRAYEIWVESDGYSKQSALENEEHEKQKSNMIKIIGEKSYHDISDHIIDLACRSERAGFEYGFRMGIEFMLGKAGEEV